MGAKERELLEIARSMGMGRGSSMDLRLYRLDAVTKMAEDFDRDCRTGLGKESSLILKIKGETLREFYGFDMHSRVGYEEPESEEDQEDNNVVGCRESQESEPTEEDIEQTEFFSLRPVRGSKSTSYTGTEVAVDDGTKMRSIEPKEKHLAPTPKHQSPCSTESREASVATEQDEQSKAHFGASELELRSVLSLPRRRRLWQLDLRAKIYKRTSATLKKEPTIRTSNPTLYSTSAMALCAGLRTPVDSLPAARPFHGLSEARRGRAFEAPRCIAAAAATAAAATAMSGRSRGRRSVEPPRALKPSITFAQRSLEVDAAEAYALVEEIRAFAVARDGDDATGTRTKHWTQRLCRGLEAHPGLRPLLQEEGGVEAALLELETRSEKHTKMFKGITEHHAALREGNAADAEEYSEQAAYMAEQWWIRIAKQRIISLIDQYYLLTGEQMRRGHPRWAFPRESLALPKGQGFGNCRVAV
ncbi:unnamed protein product [Symbiodinium microadriaticum]|nr:unnamed protein product [Symbiodinium microadriaticum]